jgi:serine/threonine-protein kinase
VSRSRSSRYAGRYELVGLLGVGGMGSVYRVRDLVLQSEVALKILRKDLAESPVSVARFHREVKLARRISHHNVVRIFDAGECDGEHYYTMECIVGEVISTVISAPEGVELLRALDIAVQITSGVSAAHKAGVIHRDLKPENVLLARDGRVVITDFGVAFARDEPDHASLPMRGAGTPLYMSPEQIEGRALDERTDLYAIGLLTYEMVTGGMPWGREDDTANLLARLSVPAPPARTFNPQVPASLELILQQLLEREPSERPADADTVLRVLQGCLKDAPGALPSVPSPLAHVTLRPPPAVAAIPTTSTPHLRAVALLPMKNLGPAEADYIAEALTEELTEQLIVCPGIRIVSRLAMRMEDGGDAVAIGRRAAADVVIESTLHRRPASMLRVRVRMVEMERGFVLWSERFERPISELFELQADMAQAIAATLTLQMRRQRRDPGPENRSNLEPFLRAKRAYAAWSPAGCQQALGLLSEALKLSPVDPLLLCYQALTQLRLWQLDPHAPSSAASDSQLAASGVLQNLPNVGEAHLALGIHAMLETNWSTAAQRLEEAIRCNPALSDAHCHLGMMRCWTGHVEEGLRMLDVALRLDPKNLPAIWTAALTLGMTARTQEAFHYLDRADFIIENHPTTLSTRLRVAFWHGERRAIAQAHDAAVGADLDPDEIEAIIVGLFIDPEPDREVGALTALAASPRSPPALRGRLMQLAAERIVMSGHVEEAWSALRAMAPHSIDVHWFKHCPALLRMTRMPAFLSLRAQVSSRAAAIFERAARP